MSVQYEGDVQAILPRGEALVRADDGQHVLVANALPGERIAFDASDKRCGSARGRLHTVLKASADRVEPACHVAAQCGGCALQYLDVAAHGALKSAWVHDAFAPLMDTNTQWMPWDNKACATAKHAGVRRRVRWHIGHDEQGYYLGFRALASHAVVRHSSPGAHCMVLDTVLHALQRRLEVLAPPWLKTCASVQAMVLHDGVHVVLETDTMISIADDICAPLEVADDVWPLQYWQCSADVLTPCTKPALALHERLNYKNTHIDIRVGPMDFLQADATVNQMMMEQIIAWSQGVKRVVDLFSGNGNLSLPIAAFVAGVRVRGADSNASAVRMANFNAKALAVDAQYQTLDLFDPKQDLSAFVGADVLILDPPRKGAKHLCKAMGYLLPASIISVHCDLASGARDAVALKQAGFRLQALRVLDMFAYAGHVEVLSLWVRV